MFLDVGREMFLNNNNVGGINKKVCQVNVGYKEQKINSKIELFIILDIMPIDNCIKYSIGIQMYILLGNAPSYLCKLFSVNDTMHNHVTRNSHSLYIPRYK